MCNPTTTWYTVFLNVCFFIIVETCRILDTQNLLPKYICVLTDTNYVRYKFRVRSNVLLQIRMYYCHSQS
jgi:hypothetical protein